MPNPLTDDLSPEAKLELAAIFADLRRQYPPVRIECIGGFTISHTLPQTRPWNVVRSGW